MVPVQLRKQAAYVSGTCKGGRWSTPDLMQCKPCMPAWGQAVAARGAATLPMMAGPTYITVAQEVARGALHFGANAARGREAEAAWPQLAARRQGRATGTPYD